MQISTKFTLRVATLLFALLLVTPVVMAGTANCPVEPATNKPIASGAVLAGPNCALYTRGDVDSFVFNANSGDTYQLVMAINGANTASTNICMVLYNPSRVQIFSGCTSVGWPNYQYYVVTDQTLTATGSYTMNITETAGAGAVVVNYAASLERLYPFPSNAQPVNLGRPVHGYLSPLTDSNAFTFESVTTGTYQVSATLPSSASRNLCMTVYLPTGTAVSTKCTSIGWPNYQYTIQIDFSPPQNGTSMAFFYVAGNDGTNTYTLEVSCQVGVCSQDTQPLTENAP